MFDFELEQEPWKMMSTSSNSFDNDDEYRFMSSPAASEFHPEEIPQGSKTRVRGRRTKKETASGHARKRLLSEEQVKLLETRFAEDRKLECKRKVQLSNELGLEPKQVAVWFQNRRARDKSKRMEAAFLELQSIYHDTVIKKCQIENEVLQLKQKLLEAQEQQRKLSDLVTRSAAAGSEKVGSPSSPTLTRKTNGAEFGVVEASDELMYIEHNNYMMDWWAIPCMQHLTPNCCVSNYTNLGV